MRKIVYLFIFLFTYSAYCQSLSLFNVDVSTYPSMRVKFYAFDNAGKQILNLAPADVIFTENGQPKNLTFLNCPPPTPPVAISSVLVFDMSISMDWGPPRIQSAKDAANSWVDGLPVGQSECALVSFSTKSYIVQDFTTDKPILKTKINQLITDEGTNYNQALLDAPCGGLQIAKTGKYKRVIIFLTDGEPNFEPNTAGIIKFAKQNQITIYAVTLDMPAPQCIKDMTKETGGGYFENITTQKEAEETYKKLLILAQSNEPCEIAWTSDYSCQSGVNNLELKVPTLNLSSPTSYQKPSDKIAKLEFSPSFVMFKNVKPGTTRDTTITVTARNTNFNVTNITSNNPLYDINPKSFNVVKNKSKQITISYSPTDSLYSNCSFEIETDVCPISLFASAIYSKYKTNPSTLKLTHPNGGEEFLFGIDTTITWEGLSPGDTVKIEYTIDDGLNWNIITGSATGLAYTWKNVPKPVSDKCKIRITEYRDVEFGTNDLITNKGGHFKNVTMAKWNRDGTLLATASDDNRVIIWDAIKGIILKIIDFDGINYIEWSPIDNRFATATSDGSAYIFAPNDYQPYVGFHHTVDNFKINCVSWNSDGTKIATAGDDGFICIWDAKSGKRLQLLTIDNNPINIVKWSPNGSSFVTANNDNQISIWDADHGGQLKILSGHSSYINAISWSPDGTRIVSASDDYSTIIWDVATGTKIYTLKNNGYFVNDAIWNSDGSQLLTVNDNGTVYIWDATTGLKIYNLSGHTGEGVKASWSSDNSKIVTAGLDSLAQIWDASTGSIINTLKGHNGSINSVHWNPNGKTIATASSDTSAIIWDAVSGLIINKLKGHTSHIVCAKVSPNGKYIASGSEDGNVIIWDGINLNLKETLKGHTQKITNICWSPDGTRLATSSRDKSAIVWNSLTGEKLYTINHNSSVEDISWSPDGSKIATANYGSITTIYNATNGSLIQKLNRSDLSFKKVIWSPDGSYLAAIGDDKVGSFDCLVIWETTNGQLLSIYGIDNKPNVNVCWCPNGSYYVTNNTKKLATIFDASNGDTVISLINGNMKNSQNFFWKPDGSQIALNNGGNIYLFDALSGKFQKKFDNCFTSRNINLWSPDLKFIIGILDQTNRYVVVLDASTGNLLHQYNVSDDESTVSWCTDSKRIATFEREKISLWNAEYPEFSLQQDESDNVFSIVAPNQKIDDLNLKKCLVGNTKDSIIINFITNTGLFKLRVDSIYITGADAKCFKLVSGKPKYELRPGRNKNAEFSFTPSKVGINTATLNIKTQSEVLQRTIQGEGVQPKLQLITDFIDFGRIEIGRDTTITDRILVKNVSGSELIVKGVAQLGPDKTQFEILNGGGSFTLQQDETRKLTIRFKPINIERTSNFLGFEYDGLGTPAKVQLYGEGVNNKPKLESNMNDFPDLICQNSAQTDLTIRNIGGKPLIVNSLLIKGISSQDFSVPGFTGFNLNPNDSKQLTVLFKPKQIGTRYADIEIKSNAFPDSITILPISAKKDSLNLSYIESTIDLGFLCPNEVKDTVLTIKNFGSIKTGAYLVGNTNISLNNNELVLQPDGIFELSFTFNGLNSEGNINENIIITDSICGISKRIFITGKVALPKIEAQDLNIKSELNVRAQGVITIKNIGDRDIIINNPPVVSQPFKILGNSFPATIKSKDSLKFSIEFLPTDIQDHFAKIYLPIEPCNFTKEVNIAGVVSSAKVTINNANCEAYPGDIIEIPISLLHATNLQYSGITGLDLDLIYNPTLLSPRDYSSESINNMNSKISFKDLPITGPDLTKIKFIVGLGNAESCDLILENVKPIGGTANIDVENGTFKLLGICREGGTRLFNPTGKAEILSIIPNPASEDIEIKVNLIEDGATIVSIYNSNGMKIKEYNIIGETGQKTINLNAKDFSNGLYFIQLQTPTVLENQKLMIIK